MYLTCERCNQKIRKHDSWERDIHQKPFDLNEPMDGSCQLFGGFARHIGECPESISWQDKERERYEGKLRDNFTVDGERRTRLSDAIEMYGLHGDVRVDLAVPAASSSPTLTFRWQQDAGLPTAVVVDENDSSKEFYAQMNKDWDAGLPKGSVHIEVDTSEWVEKENNNDK